MTVYVNDNARRFLGRLNVARAQKQPVCKTSGKSASNKREPHASAAAGSVASRLPDLTEKVLALLGKTLIPPDYSDAGDQLELSRPRLNKEVAHLEDVGLLVSYRLATKRRGGARKVVVPTPVGLKYLREHDLPRERDVTPGASPLHNAIAKAEGENHKRLKAEVTYEHTVRSGDSSGVIRADVRIKIADVITYSQACVHDPVRESSAAQRLIESTHESFRVRLIGKDQPFLNRLDKRLAELGIAPSTTPRLELFTAGQVLDRYYRKESP